MKYGTRVFLVLEGKIKRIGVDRFSQIGMEAMPEYAGQRIPYAILLFEREGDRLGDLRYHEGGCLVFDKEGNLDQTGGLNRIRLAQAGENDPKSFAARRAEQVKRENRWSPTGEQLSQMIALAKKKRRG